MNRIKRGSPMDTETADAGFLNARQEAFCREFVAGGSAVAAARAAGYAETTARAQAGRLLQHPNIQHRIDQLRADEADAKAALCGRLLQDAHAIRERAIANGDDRMALQAITTTLRVVRQLGMPATPADTQDVLLDSAHADAEAEAAMDAGDADAPDAEPRDDADPADDPDPMATAMAETLTAVSAPTGRAAAAPAGADGDRLAAMLASVGECRSDGPVGGPTSAKPP
jgi:phage terminase small subunit